MRQAILLSLTFCAQLAAQTFYVCTSGSMEDGRACTHNTLQAAVDAAGDGSTIIVRSGDTVSQIGIPRGRRNLTIKSSKIDDYPRGHRIVRNDPALAKIVLNSSAQAAVTIGQDDWWSYPAIGANTFEFNWFHGWPVGKQVIVTGALLSPWYCTTDRAAPFGNDCPTGSAGFFAFRGAWANLVNGNVVYFSSASSTLPSPLTADTPYYVINKTAATRFQIAATPGGTPIILTGYDPLNPPMMEYPLAPLRRNEVVYVVDVLDGKKIKVSNTPGGSPVTFTQTPGLVRVQEMRAVENLTIDGFEITTASPAIKPYMLVYVPNNTSPRETEASGLRILRSWIHPYDAQTAMPNQGIILGARDAEVAYSIIEDLWSNNGDTQAIFINSRGNIWIHDNELSATGESVMSGGNFPAFYPDGTKNIRVERNYFRKPLKWFANIVALKLTASTFRLVRYDASSLCSGVAANTTLFNRCFWYDGSEAAGWTRRELAADLEFAVSGTPTGQIYIYGEGGQVKLRHNLADASGLICPESDTVVCSYSATPSFPATGSRFTLVNVTAGVVADNVWFENKPPFVKNALESKRGDNWLIEGNVFHRQFYPIQGSLTQDMLINLTVAPNGSGATEPVDATVSTSYSIIRNNIFRHSPKGVVAVGRSFGYPEITGHGKNIANRMENNLFFDIGSSDWTRSESGNMFQLQGVSDWVVSHNTAIDTRWAVAGLGGGNTIAFTSNLIVPQASDNVGAQGYLRYPEIRDIDNTGLRGWTAVKSAWAGPASTFTGNYLHVRGTANIPGGYVPSGNYLSSPGGALSSTFTAWAERGATDWTGSWVRSIDPRLQQTTIANFASADSRAIGADIDEIEAITGRHGADVEIGVPIFAERSARDISAGSTKAVISYLPNDTSCTVKVWSNSSYNGPAAAEATDANKAPEEGRINVLLTGLTPATDYYGKRWCGPAVDVFRFVTGEAADSTVALSPPPGVVNCAVEYGSTASLGTITDQVAVSGGRCTVSVPSSSGYWRHVYRDSSGQVIAKGTVQARGL